MTLTIDANVWLAAEDPSEPGFDVCSQFLERALASTTELCSPTLLIVEIAATIARKTRSDLDGRRLADRIAQINTHRWYPLDLRLAEVACDLAGRCFLRGADAVYVAVASLSGAMLVSQDREVIERSASVIQALSPSDWLAFEER